VLTSLSEAALARVGVTRRLADQVETLADLAQQAGLDGVVASPWETPRLRARCGESFAIVTPGIRAGGEQARDDQARTLSAAEAVRAGATYIVVGRPIIRAPDPAAAARAICEELAAVRAGSRQRGAIGIRLCLYTRPRCHLCDEMKAVLDRVAARAAIEVQEVDISERTDLERAYGWDVPVLVRDGEILAKHRVTEDELMALLQRPNPRPLAPEP